MDEIAFLLGHRDANVTRAVYVRELSDTRRRTMRRSRMIAEYGDLFRTRPQRLGAGHSRRSRSYGRSDTVRIVSPMAHTSLFREVRVRVLDDEMRLFRACFQSPRAAQLDSFRSHYELDRPPRGPEERATVIHMGVSMFETAAPCWNLLERTQGRIGDCVAELLLGPGRGICVAKTGGPFHWSVWGRPGELQAAIVGFVRR